MAGKTLYRIIIRINTAAPLEITERYEVMLTGAPSYTSAAHRWNGTMEILKAIPLKKKMKAMTCNGFEEIALDISVK
jgi:hypothetical protein